MTSLLPTFTADMLLETNCPLIILGYVEKEEILLFWCSRVTMFEIQKVIEYSDIFHVSYSKIKCYTYINVRIMCNFIKKIDKNHQ